MNAISSQEKFYAECGQSQITVMADEHKHAAGLLCHKMRKNREAFGEMIFVSKCGFMADLIEMQMSNELREGRMFQVSIILRENGLV